LKGRSGVRQSPGSKAGGRARRFSGAIQEGIGRRMNDERGQARYLPFSWCRQRGNVETERLRGRGVVLRMGERFVGFVVVDRAVVFVMVLQPLFVLDFVRERFRAVGVRLAALQGEAIQGKAEQQQEVDEPAQESRPRLVAGL